MKKNICLATLFFTLALFCLLLFSFASAAENLYDSVIRIHVLANSDDAEDQEVKLLVRDALLSYAEQHFSQVDSRNEASTAVIRHLPAMKEEAERVLQQEGFSYGATLTLEEEHFDTRHYHDFSLPEGDYLSLQVRLGESQGQNWWCVLFPPVCLNSAKGTAESLSQAGMEEKNVKTVTSEKSAYQIRFKALELWGQARRKISLLFS